MQGDALEPGMAAAQTIPPSSYERAPMAGSGGTAGEIVAVSVVGQSGKEVHACLVVRVNRTNVPPVRPAARPVAGVGERVDPLLSDDPGRTCWLKSWPRFARPRD